jgi:hypothetical protein
MPASLELKELAISPDDRTLVVAARYDQLFVFDLGTMSTTIAINLPKDGSEAIQIGGLAFLPSGSLLVVASAVTGPSQYEGRVYVAGPRGHGLHALPARIASTSLEAVKVDPESAAVRVIGYQPLSGGNFRARIFAYDGAQERMGSPSDATLTAGCQDLAFVGDGAGGRMLALACGVNNGAVGVYDPINGYSWGPSTGNTAHLAARPQGDYALGVAWSNGRLPRVELGVWMVGFNAPDLGSTLVYDLAFSDDGARALIVGRHDTVSSALVLREYRHDLYNSSALTDVSIQGFDRAPYGGTSGVTMNDVAWRPQQDCGFMAGGCSVSGCTRGYLIAFTVTNGRACR